MSRGRKAWGPLTTTRAFDVPLTIGVISDTHVNARPGGREISDHVFDLFRRADVGLIVHLGDVNTVSVLEDLAELAPTIAVVGNNDDLELQYMLKEHVRFTVGRHRFGAVHGHGGRSGREHALRTLGDKVDFLMFGHSHKPLIEQVGEVTLFNPGSATDRRWFAHFGIGIIHVTDEKIDPELILYVDPAHLQNVDV